MEVETPIKENDPEVQSSEKVESNDKNDSGEENATVAENGKGEELENEADTEMKEPVDSNEVSEQTSENTRTASNEDDSIETNNQENDHSGKTEDSDVLESEKTDELEGKETDNLEDKQEENVADGLESKETDETESKESDESDNKKTEEVESEQTDKTESKETDKSKSDDTKSPESEIAENLRSQEGNADKKENGEANNGEANEIVQNGVSDENSRMDIDDNDEDDDYFNPLLLCPDISMDVDESPVVTTGSSEPPSNDLSDPNSLFEPLFSTFVDEMTGAEISFNLTAEEQILKDKLYGPNNPIQYTKIHCTACNVHLGSALAGQTNRFVHPLLKVLICKECYHFYTSGEFEKDEDGSELYCRWCGQGGQVLCCTMCEFVFCKKCIRINFGRKKLIQVRDSDDWKCFRCDMSQLKALRAMCVEFFEYIRKEKARASAYTNPDQVNKDLTNCCQTSTNRKRSTDQDQEKEAPVRKKRRRVEEDDPDYDPYKKEEDEGSNSSIPSTSGVKVTAAPAKPPPAKPAVVIPKAPTPETSKSPAVTMRIGNTIVNRLSTAVRSSGPPPIRPKPAFTPRPMVPNAVRPAAAQQPIAVSSAQVRPATGNRQTPPQHVMKHEWFEKTVRAAARVNSNLSYTLTQLNKAQSSASSVEQLAVVHNKLQEILSSSINSLIQIRKNLRTEFIAGIKTIRFPPKPAVDPNDDDVIIVNSVPSKPSSSRRNTTTLTPIAKPVRTTPNATMKTYTVNSSTPSSSTPGKGYLKVRSFSQLQNVTSECITIPDDDPPPPPPKPKEPIVVEINEEEVAKDTPQKDEDYDSASEFKGFDSKKEEEKEKRKNDDKEKTKDDEKEKGEDNEKEKEKDESETDENTHKAKSKDEENEKGDESIQKDGKNKNKEKKDDEDKNKEKKDDKDKNKEKEDDKDKNKEKEDDKDKNEKEKNGSSDSASKTNGDESKTEDTEKSNGDVNDEVTVKTEPEENSYNVKDQPSPKIRRMLSVKVNLKKSAGVEELVKKEPVENGD